MQFHMVSHIFYNWLHFGRPFLVPIGEIAQIGAKALQVRLVLVQFRQKFL